MLTADLIEFVVVGALLGSLAGVLAGMLGVGGGLLIVPVLAVYYSALGVAAEEIMNLAIGTSLASIIFTSISSVRAHHQRGAVHWAAFRQMSPGILFGAALGAYTATLIDPQPMRWLFALFELAVAGQMLLSLRANPSRSLPGPGGMATSGGLIGWVSGLLGIGGGTLSVPFLVWCQTPMRQAVGTASALGLPIAIAGALGFVLLGLDHSRLPAHSLGYVHLPSLLGIVLASTLTAPIGAWLAHRLPVAALKKTFAILLIILAIRLVG